MWLLRAFTVLAVMFTLIRCRAGEGPPAASAAGVAAWQPARIAELYFTTEVSGYIEPCGCTTAQLGGLPRLAAVLKRGRAARGLVDAGNLLFPSEGFDEVSRDQHRLKAGLLARVYRRLGVSALNVGPGELHEGAEFLKTLQHEGATPFVSANIRPVGGHGPEVAASFLRTIGKIRVGITGATPPESAYGANGMTALEYAPAVTAEVQSLRERGADVVVVLTHLSQADARELAVTVPGIDLILRAPGTPFGSPLTGPERVENTVIAEAGQQGQYVGRVTIALGPAAPTQPLALDEGDRSYRRWRRLTERKIKAFTTEVEAWKDDPTKAAAVKAKRGLIEGLAAKLARPPPRLAPPTSPYVRIEQVALSHTIKPDAEVEAMLTTYYSQLEAMNAEKGDPKKCAPVPGQPTYVGTAACAQCHPEAVAFWRKTGHGKAWETLVTRGKQYDLTCVGCHVVGYQKPGGFCRVKDVAGYEDVGCENCHGPGSEHVRTSEAESIVLRSTPATCADQCHVPEHSQEFEFASYLLRVTGPGHAVRKE